MKQALEVVPLSPAIGAEIRGVVGTADERAAGDVAETFRECDFLQLVEGVRGDVFDHRQVLRRGAQILAQREDGDVVFKQIVQRAEDFIAALPEDPLCEPFSTPRRTVLVPYPELASRWAASAWGFALNADCFDAAPFEAFYLEHVGRGREALCNPNAADVAALCR